MFTSQIQHSDIVSYADDNVNLDKDSVKEYREQVNNLRDKLERHIQANPDFDLVKMLNSGSVAKGTALKIINDMDVAVYLNHSLESEENELLDWLMQRLKDAYSNLKPEQFSCPSGSHCVTISFKSTGRNGLDVDVVPVIVEDNTEDYGFLVTQDTGDRVLTNITLHLEFIRKRKDTQPIHFAQIVRLIKWWVKQQKIKDDSFRFKSLMVELICAHLVDYGVDISDYPDGLLKFFGYILKTGLKERIYFADYYDPSLLPKENTGVIEIFDPVNPVNNIASKYTEQDLAKILASVSIAFDALTYAKFATTKQEALDMWKLVLGPSFNL